MTKANKIAAANVSQTTCFFALLFLSLSTFAVIPPERNNVMLTQGQLNEYNEQGIISNETATIVIHVPTDWMKFEAILLARYQQPQTKMKLSKEQLNSFIHFLNNLTQPTPELLKLQATLPKTTLELMRSIESRNVSIAEAEKIALYLQDVPEKFAVKKIAAFDENTSHIIGREWREIDYGGEGMTWEKQQQKYQPYGITNFKSLENLTKFFPVESKLPYFRKVYG